MKVISHQVRHHPKLTIVCCLHGDERFGVKVFRYYQKHLRQYPGLRVILANEAALRINRRYIHHDLNRVFFRKPARSYEGRLATDILQQVRGSDYLLDIHTTSSSIVMTPIVAFLGRAVREIIHYCRSREIVLMGHNYAKKSLIGNVPNGVSLEFNEQYARKKNALIEVQNIVHGILKKPSKPTRLRKVFTVRSVIARDVEIPAQSKNFEYLPSLKLYPFLLHERSYRDLQGFSASSCHQVRI